VARGFTGSSSQYLSRTDVLGLTAYPLSCAVWFYYSVTLANPALLSFGKLAGNNFIQLVLAGSDDSLGLRVDAGSTDSLNSASVPSTNAWHHAGCVIAASNDMRLFLDGVKATLSGTQAFPSGMNKFSIGASVANSPSVNQFLTGRACEAGVWNAALDDAEMGALAKGIAPSLIRPASLVAYWPLWGNDSPELDRWNSRYDLTLTASPTKVDHPRMVYPSRGRMPSLVAAAGGGARLSRLSLLGAG
jgi:hypothetical protein